MVARDDNYYSGDTQRELRADERRRSPTSRCSTCARAGRAGRRAPGRRPPDDDPHDAALAGAGPRHGERRRSSSPTTTTSGRVERTIDEDVVLRPGLNPVQLLADDPIKPGQGRITAKVKVNPNVADSDPSNNTGEGSRAVVQPRPLKVLFVPVAADDELAPACADVRDVADGTEEFMKAAWPVDPATLSTCSRTARRTIVHPPGLTEAGLMESGDADVRASTA